MQSLPADTAAEDAGSTPRNGGEIELNATANQPAMTSTADGAGQRAWPAIHLTRCAPTAW